MKITKYFILIFIYFFFMFSLAHWNYDNKYSVNNWEFLDFWTKNIENKNMKITDVDVELTYINEIKKYKYFENKIYKKLIKVLPEYNFSSVFIDYADAQSRKYLHYTFNNLQNYTISNTWNTSENYTFYLYPTSPYNNYLDKCSTSNKIIMLPNYWMKNIEILLDSKKLIINKKYKFEKIENNIINYSCEWNKIKNNYILYPYYQINISVKPHEIKTIAVSYDSLQYFQKNMNDNDKNKFLSSAFWYYFTQEKSNIPTKVEWNIENNFELLINKNGLLEKTSTRIFNNIRNVEFQIKEKSKK